MRRFVIALLFALGCAEPATRARVGEPAPQYVAPTLSGDSVALVDLHGQVVMLNVWATWCIPCRKELPELEAMHKEYAARGLKVVGVSVDDGNADDDVKEFVERYGLTYTIVRDPGEEVSTLFFTPGVPSSFLIDRNGIVVWRHMGPFTANDPQLLSALRQAL
jgi:cytochrome c-type biogenesis protein